MKKELPSNLCLGAEHLGGFLSARVSADSPPVTKVDRDELLAKCAADEHVELLIDIVAYEQTPGVSNRNFVRFREGGLAALARSGRQTVFIADHDQSSLDARGGTIISSRLEKEGETARIVQTVKLTAPWAVSAALRGLIDRFSIGWRPTGDVHCSLCDDDLYQCEHWPGREYDGAACEVLFVDAELIETSAVNVPAVPQAQIEGIRAALSLASKGGVVPQKEKSMQSKMIATLGLAATAGEDEILKAVDGLRDRAKLAETARDEIVIRALAAESKLASYEQILSKQSEERFIEDGIRVGKIVPQSGYAQSLRALYAKDPVLAAELLAGAPVVTPVGAPRQASGPDLNPTKVGTDLSPLGLSADAVASALKQLGHSNPHATIEKFSNRLLGK